jgi:tyrosine-protein kinase Tec
MLINNSNPGLNPNATIPLDPTLILDGAKLVIAVYPFTAIEPGDLSLVKGEEYTVVDDSQDHWWQVVNKICEKGFIPSNYVKEKDALGLQNFEW